MYNVDERFYNNNTRIKKKEKKIVLDIWHISKIKI